MSIDMCLIQYIEDTFMFIGIVGVEDGVEGTGFGNELSTERFSVLETTYEGR